MKTVSLIRRRFRKIDEKSGLFSSISKARVVPPLSPFQFFKDGVTLSDHLCQSISFHPIPRAHEVAGVAGVVAEVGDSSGAVDKTGFGIVGEHEKNAFCVVAAGFWLPSVVRVAVFGGNTKERRRNIVRQAGERRWRGGRDDFCKLWAKCEEGEFHGKFENAGGSQKDQKHKRVCPMGVDFAADCKA